MNKVFSAGTATQGHPRCPFLFSWVFENETGLGDVFVEGCGGFVSFCCVVSSDWLPHHMQGTAEP